jgi:RNA polymerase sigma factor (sigma-70 family)
MTLSVIFSSRRPTSGGPAPDRSSADAGHGLDFHKLVLPHLDGAYNLARYLTRDPVLSEDIVQDAVLRAYRAFGQFRGGSARAWLFAIVRNCCRTAQPGTGGPVALVADSTDSAADHADPAATPEQEILRKSEIERVRAAIEAIPEPFRETVVLRDLEELSYAEIAGVAGVAIGTVMSRLSRGRSMLAKELLPEKSFDRQESRSVK